jgi:hypothetical protein
LIRLITQTLAAAESVSDPARRKATSPPAGERAGRISPTALKVIGIARPPAVETA